jgi:hypothetical protein
MRSPGCTGLGRVGLRADLIEAAITGTLPTLGRRNGVEPSLTVPRISPVYRRTLSITQTRSTTHTIITTATLVNNGCRPPLVGSHMSLDSLRESLRQEKTNEAA